MSGPKIEREKRSGVIKRRRLGSLKDYVEKMIKPTGEEIPFCNLESRERPMKYEDICLKDLFAPQPTEQTDNADENETEDAGVV